MSRETLRNKILGAKHSAKSKIVEWEGEKFEVRQPTVKGRNDLYKKCIDDNGQMDMTAFIVWGAILHTYAPNSDDLVFEDADYDVLSNLPSGGFLDLLSEAVSEVIGTDRKKTTKN